MHFSIGDGVGIVSAAIVLVAGLLPWASVTVPPQVRGYTPTTVVRWGYQEPGGLVMIILSLVSLSVIAFMKGPVLKTMAIGTIGGLVILTASTHYLSGGMSVECVPGETREGLPMSLMGGLGLVASIALLRAHKEEPSPTQSFSNESPI